jgi:drug/metabolite transporter (DMT)-like permease
LTVVLVLVSAFFHALWNALLRVEPDKDRGLVAAIAVASLLACVIAAVRWAIGQVPFATAESVGWTLLAGAFEAVYFATLARALERGPLGAVYTISRGGAVLVVWPLSILLFHEIVTLTSASGSALVFGGLVLCGIGAHGVRGSRDKSGPSGVTWAVLCAISIAGYHLAYKAALLSGASSSASFALSLSLSALISFARIDRTGMRALLRTRWHRIGLMGVVCGGSFLILMEALALGGSGYVLTLRNTSVLFAAVLAYFIGERPAHPELVGAAAVAGGAVLMAW